MKSVDSRILIFILTIFILLADSCSPGGCFDETESKVKATMYSMETGKTQAPDSLTLYGAGMDTTMIYDKEAMVSIAEFPLYASEQNCAFIIRINGINDTMVFSYSSFEQLISKECGYTFYYSLDTVWYSLHNIDSVSMIKKTVTTFNEENLRIYY